MRTKVKLVIGGASIACVIAGLAMATPTIGAWYNVILSTGTANRDVHVHAHLALPGTEEGFSAELETEGPSNFIVQEVKLSTGGTTGWHTTPNLAAQFGGGFRSIDWYDANCAKHVYNAGDSWTEGTKLHDVVNSSSIDAHFLVTYVVAKGVNKRTDQPAPACAAALGLN
jgi:hypothetical protein